METRCAFCDREIFDTMFVVKGRNGKIMCNECLGYASIMANQFCFDPGNDWVKCDVSKKVLWVEDIHKEENMENMENKGNMGIAENAENMDKLENAVREINSKKQNVVSDLFDLRPKDIKEKLDSYVIGQENAKKILSVAVYNHIKRLCDTTGLIKKSNILMLGPSGSGKTLLAQTLAEILDVPFAIADATALTQTGYAGDDVDSILTRLYLAANGDERRAERGIIYIDEIDKIADRGGDKYQICSKNVQYDLLKIIEGADMYISDTVGDTRNKYIEMNTKDILFICGGAFEGLEKTKKVEKNNRLGFYAEAEEANEEDSGDEITPEQLVRYGMTTEFMGRLPIIVKLDELTEDDLVRVLTEPKNAITKEYKELLEYDNIDLEFEDDALREIAKTAIDKKIGARGLRSVVEKMMLDIMFSGPSESRGKKCLITKETVHSRKARYDVKCV